MAVAEAHMPGNIPREAMKASPWVARFAAMLIPGGPVLDVAAGAGRHVRLMRALGHPVTAVDRDVSGMMGLAAGDPGVELFEFDLESGGPWPFASGRFAGIVVTNYLHRPLLGDIAAGLAPGGILIYETFAVGNEAFGRPRRPAFLLRPGELLDVARGAGLSIVAYEEGAEAAGPARRVMQRICAARGGVPRDLPPAG